MNSEALILFPHQLIRRHSFLSKERTVYLVEDARFFTAFKFCKQKLILHRASMKAYEAMLTRKGYTVRYIPFGEVDGLFSNFKKERITCCYVIDPVDTVLEKRIRLDSQAYGIKLMVGATPLFLTPIEWFAEFFAGKRTYFMTSFYIAQRKRLDILVDANKKPIGGKWTYDKENRQPPSLIESIPSYYVPRKNKFVKEAMMYVNRHFPTNPGSSDDFWFPVTHRQADKWFDDFLEHRLIHFGDYEDAMMQDQVVLFHSALSSSLNIGLLTPADVVKRALQVAAQKNVALNNIEGFIRQIIGWREFVRGVYCLEGKKQRKGNYWRHKRVLPLSFWSATTGLYPVDCVIKRVLTHAYAHHIERLMVLGNVMLLCGIRPDDVYQWFMELFIDAYDWVMVPNVYGMSQYADGGLMTTKPYISGSGYIQKMSTFKKGEWTEIWNALYWNFVSEHRKKIADNPRLRVMTTYLNRMSREKRETYKKVAQRFLRKLDT